MDRLSELRVYDMEAMSLDELINAIRTRRDHLPPDLLERLEEQSIPCLQLRLLAARMIEVLRHPQRRG
jgi:hypothetical protein